MMYSANFWKMAGGYGTSGMFDAWMGSWLGIFLFPLVVWSLVWKGWALWKAAKADSSVWFIILLILNTAGILDIIYIFLISKPRKSTKKK